MGLYFAMVFTESDHVGLGFGVVAAMYAAGFAGEMSVASA